MMRVIQSLFLGEQALQNVPDFLEKLGRGLMVTVDATQWFDAEHRTSLLVEPGRTVRIHRPDGSVIERIVTGVAPPSSKVALFFSDTEQHEIPRLSEIELPA